MPEPRQRFKSIGVPRAILLSSSEYVQILFARSSPEPRHRTRQALRRSLRSKCLIGRAAMTPIEILHCLAIRQKVCPIFANVSHTNLCFCLQAVKSSLRKGARLETCQKRWQPPGHRRKDPPAVSCALAYSRVPIYCAHVR